MGDEKLEGALSAVKHYGVEFGLAISIRFDEIDRLGPC